ncbi:hypothetical protein G6F65_017964 [Rhizopus arrhizus]|nr:hypothetical protein G6F65_017964 [Rhizopus arrhizus]
MRGVGQKAPFPVQRRGQAFKQAIDGLDERLQFTGHPGGRQGGQVHGRAAQDGVARAVHRAEGPAHDQPGHPGQYQEEHTQERETVTHALGRFLAQLRFRLGELDLYAAVPVCHRVGAPAFAAQRDVLEAVLKIADQGFIRRPGRLHKQPLVGQRPHLEVEGLSVEAVGVGEFEAVFAGRRSPQQAGRQGQPRFLGGVAHVPVQHAGLGARLFVVDQRQHREPGGKHRKQQSDRDLFAQRLHGAPSGTMRYPRPCWVSISPSPSLRRN